MFLDFATARCFKCSCCFCPDFLAITNGQLASKRGVYFGSGKEEVELGIHAVQWDIFYVVCSARLGRDDFWEHSCHPAWVASKGRARGLEV